MSAVDVSPVRAYVLVECTPPEQRGGQNWVWRSGRTRGDDGMTLRPSAQTLVGERSLELRLQQRDGKRQGPTVANTTLPAMAAPPTILPVDSTDSLGPEINNASAPTDEGTSKLPGDGPAPSSPDQRVAPQDLQTQQRVRDVLHSDIGVITLLSRLKASIASARVRNLDLGCTSTLTRLAGLLQFPQAARRIRGRACCQSQETEPPHH